VGADDVPASAGIGTVAPDAEYEDPARLGAKGGVSREPSRPSQAEGLRLGNAWGRARSFSLLPPPALGEGNYRRLTRLGIAVRWRSILVLRERQRPHPRRSYGGRHWP
jgi:hypothetical protein